MSYNKDMFHPSRILSIFLGLFLLACVVFTLKIPPWAPGIFLTAVLFMSVILFRKITWLRYALLLLLVVGLSALRVWTVTPRQDQAWWGGYKDQEVRAKLIIISEPKVSGKSQVFLARSWSGSPRGNLEITTGQLPLLHFGDVVEVDGKIKANPEITGFAKANFITGQMLYPRIVSKPDIYIKTWERIYFPLRANLISIKNSYVSMTGRLLPEPQAGLLSGIIFGTKAELSTLLVSILTITGTVHIIALSGYNITIIADGSRYLTRGLNRNLAFWLPIAGILVFVLATGLSASIIRAAIMGAMLLLAGRLGRQPDGLNAVLVSSALMVFVNPYIILYDIGFQLSFAAVTGIIFLAPKISRFFSFMGPMLSPIMAGTVAAQIFSWPIIALSFGRISLISIVANALILPIIPYVMGIGFGVISLAFLFFKLASLLAVIPWFMLTYVVKVAEALSEVKFASLSAQIGLWFAVGYLAILMELTYYLGTKIKKNV